MKRFNYLCLVGLLFVFAASAARGESIEWVRQLGTSASDGSFGVSADGLGNVYISGSTPGSLGGPSAGGNDAFVSKYDAAGNFQWTRQLGTSLEDVSYGVSADGLGNVYISGQTRGSLGGPNAGGASDAFVSKYDAAGNFQWSRQAGTNADDESRGVSADGLGNVYISGYTFGSLGGPSAGDYDAFVSKYDAAGNFQWSRQLGTSATDLSYGVSADGLGNVYISGDTRGSLGGPNAGGGDTFVSKYDAAGTLQWSRQLGTSALDGSGGVSADALGSVYITGYTNGSLGGPNAGSYDAFVSKYDAAGALQWTRQLGTSADDFSDAVSTDGLGNVYISGYTRGSLGGPNAGVYDAFLSKYDAAGNFQWTQQLGTSSSDVSFGVSADGLGNIYFSGSTTGSLGGPNAGGNDAFVVKIVDSVVPEPSTLLLLGFGSLAVLWRRRRRLVCASILTVVVGFSCADRADAVTIDTVPVGNPGNASDLQSQGTFGWVAYSYRIGTYEVSNAQYLEFLNGVDPTGANTLALYSTSMSSDAHGGINFNDGAVNGSKYEIKPGRDNNPVVWVSWYDSIRFANWMHNGMAGGDTENGAYTLSGGTPTPSNGNSITRNAGAKWWLPSENEWYKAAYHKNDGVTGNYWDYPTSTDAVPYSDQPPGAGAPDPSNTANFYKDDGLANGYDDGYAVTGSTSFSSAQNYLTDVGAYTLSDSPYGTFDQGGNVWERNETLISGSSRVLRGGSSTFGLPSSLHASGRNGISFDPRSGHSYVGFRVASIPEPNTLLLLCFGSLAVLWRRRGLVCATVLAVVVSISFTDYAQAVTIDTLPVGNPGNAPDTQAMTDGTTGYGSVGYNYRIGKYEVTNSQYVEFLNGVDPAGANALSLYSSDMSSNANGGINFNGGAANGSKYEIKSGRDNNPVVSVTWYDSIRFANWLHNGQGAGNTEEGAYTLMGGTPTPSNGNSITRNAGAKWWLPSEDEWYKAAYHKNDGVTGNYWDYPTSTDAVPYSDQPPGSGAPDPSNTGNFSDYDGSANGYNDGFAVTGTSFNFAQNYLTDVGAYTLSDSPYGTFDQGGNVREWNEALIGSSRGRRGGSWGGCWLDLHASKRVSDCGPVPSGGSLFGFRVASNIPEPSTLLLAAMAGISLLWRRRGLVCATILTTTVCISCADRAQAVTIDTVPVGNPGNVGDVQSNGTFGAVPYAYRIGKHEVTNAQYAELLNGVDPTGANTLALYNSAMSSDARGGINFNGVAANGSKYEIKLGRDNNPVVYVSWYDSIRFANWLHNGQGSGDTENGAYTLLGGTPTPSNGNSITRNVGAQWWLPNEDEWYKAAYHKNDGVTGNYWDYATKTDAVPFSDQPPGSGAPTQSNTANFFKNDSIANGFDDGYAVTGTTSFPSGNALTDVGAYTLSDGPYGTFDQGGNVREWNEALISASARGLRGGSWINSSDPLHASFRSGGDPSNLQGSGFGFRVASIPEPSTLLLGVIASSALLWRRRALS